MTQKRKPGIVAGLPNSVYHGGEDYSKSSLDIINKSPMHFKASRDAGQRESTPAQRKGTIIHSGVLEPSKFWDEYVLPLKKEDHPDAIFGKDQLVEMIEKLNEDRRPKLSGSGSKKDLIDRIIEEGSDKPFAELDAMKAADLKIVIAEMNEDREGLLSTRGTTQELVEILKGEGVEVQMWSDLVAEHEVANEDKETITEEEAAEVEAIRAAVQAHPVASKLLNEEDGEAELSCFWTDPKTGLELRCRPDFWNKKLNIIVDLKTSRDASYEGFCKSINDWRYHVQEAFYRDGINETIKQAKLGIKPVSKFVFVVIEPVAPYAIGVYTIDPLSQKIGQIEYRKNLDTLAECLEKDEWPGYPVQVQTAGLPEWKLRQWEFENAEGEAA